MKRFNNGLHKTNKRQRKTDDDVTKIPEAEIPNNSQEIHPKSAITKTETLRTCQFKTFA